MNKKERKQMIEYRLKQLQDNIKAYRNMIQDYQTELDFMNGHYAKTWEEEYDSSSNHSKTIKESDK